MAKCPLCGSPMIKQEDGIHYVCSNCGKVCRAKSAVPKTESEPVKTAKDLFGAAPRHNIPAPHNNDIKPISPYALTCFICGIFAVIPGINIIFIFLGFFFHKHGVNDVDSGRYRGQAFNKAGFVLSCIGVFSLVLSFVIVIFGGIITARMIDEGNKARERIEQQYEQQMQQYNNYNYDYDSYDWLNGYQDSYNDVEPGAPAATANNLQTSAQNTDASADSDALAFSQVPRDDVPDIPLNLPIGIPLTDGERWSIPYYKNEDYEIASFKALAGNSIIATGSGVVSKVNLAGEHGNSVTIDHGNGFISIYYFDGDPLVTAGSSIDKGDIISVVSEDTQMGYEIYRNGQLISIDNMKDFQSYQRMLTSNRSDNSGSGIAAYELGSY